MATVAKSVRLTARNRFAPAQGWVSWLAYHAWVLPIVAVALWLRVNGIGSHFLYGDEAEYSIVARYLSRDPSYLAYPTIEGFGPAPFVSQPPLLLYVMAAFMKIMGPTDMAALLPSILLGTASVIVVYALGSRLGGRFVGLSAAAVLAVLPFHIELSRKAMLDAGYVFFLLLTAYFLVRWLETRTRKHAIAVGLATTAAALSKLPGVLAGPVVLLVFLVALAIAIAKKQNVKEHAIQAGLGALPIAVGAALYLALLASLDAIGNLWVKLVWQMGRVDTSRAQVQEITQVSRDASFYLSDPKFGFAAMLGGTIVLLALVGLLVALVRFARAPAVGTKHIVVPLFMFVLGAFFFYSQRKEGFYLLPFAPLFAILVAYTADALRSGARWLASRSRSPLAGRAGIATAVLAALVVAWPAIAAAQQSFQAYGQGDTQEKYFGSGTREAAAFIHQQDPNAAQYGTLLGRFTLYWYNEQPTYHWYVDHSFIESQIKAGKLKYVAYDDYLMLAFDREYMQQLINEHKGQLVFESKQGWGDLKVFELQAG